MDIFFRTCSICVRCSDGGGMSAAAIGCFVGGCYGNSMSSYSRSCHGNEPQQLSLVCSTLSPSKGE